MTDQLNTSNVWEVKNALANADDRVSDLKELLGVWLRQSPKLISQIRSALENDDAEKLELAAHTLKGSLQILCADHVSRVAFELETAGRNHQFSNGMGLLDQLEEQIGQIQSKIVDFMNTQ